MTNDDESFHSGQKRICPECEREFVPTSGWAYRMSRGKGTKITYFCRYNCHRAAERRLDAKKAGRRNQGKLENEKIGRNTEMKSKKPSKGKLEEHLRAGASIADIARKYGASTQSVKNWIRDEGLEGIQGVKKSKGEPVVAPIAEEHKEEPVATPTAEEPIAQDSPPALDMAQPSPSLAEIEQCHTDVPVQELPKVEMDSDPRVTMYTEPQGMTEEENMTDAEWEAQEKQADPEPALNPAPIILPDPAPISPPDPIPPREPYFEVWQDIHDDIVTLGEMYVKDAKMSFRDRLRELLADVLGV